MRKAISAAALLLTVGTTSVFAADLPSAKGAPVYTPAPPVLSWTGVYVGGQIGIQWGQTSWDRFDPTNTALIASELPYSNKGVVGGGHIGYNYQVSQFVFGLEGDVEDTNFNGNGTSNGNTWANTTRADIEASIRARAGIAWNQILFFLTGGGTYAGFHNTAQNPPGNFYAGDSFGRIGWTAVVASNTQLIPIGRSSSRIGFRNMVITILIPARNLSTRVCGIIGWRRALAIGSAMCCRLRRSLRNTKPVNPASRLAGNAVIFI